MEKTAIQNDATASLRLSLMPSIFAAGCCATTPLVSFFGFSLMEQYLVEYVWVIRLAGVLLLGLAVSWYFYKQGVTTRESLKKNRSVIVITVIQTAVISLAIYSFFVFVATPIIAGALEVELQNCCSL